MCTGRILAIDDERHIRRLIQDEFSLEGFDVTTAESGEEGVRLFEEHQFDAVLLDIHLPNMNGLEVLKRLKQQSPEGSVIVIIGCGDIRLAAESVKLGALSCITKPFCFSELLTLVKQAA